MPRFKPLAASLLWYGGILGLAGRLRRALKGPRLIVLCYHHVEAGGDEIPARSASPAEFARQAEWLSGRFAVIPLSEVAGYLAGTSPLSRDAVAVTFDDGYADNYSQVLPVLERHRIPAVFFIASDPLLKRAAYWYDVLWAGLGGWDRRAVLAAALPERVMRALEDFRRNPSRPFRAQVIEAAKDLDAETRARLLAALAGAQATGAAVPVPPVMAPEEAEECVRRGVEVGGHTRTHPSLARIAEAECREEIAGSLRDLRARGFQVRYYAYPFGESADVGGTSGMPRRMMAEMRAGSGIELALTTEERAVRPGDDPLLVPRKVISPQALPQIALKLELLAWRK